VVGSGGDEERLPLRDGQLLALHGEDARPLEHHVDLVVLVRLLAVGLGRDEDVDADLQARRLVDQIVAAVPRGEPALDLCDLEAVAGPQTAAFLNTGMISRPYVSRMSSWPWVMR
jgi:hypothetical protein